MSVVHELHVEEYPFRERVRVSLEKVVGDITGQYFHFERFFLHFVDHDGTATEDSGSVRVFGSIQAIVIYNPACTIRDLDTELVRSWSSIPVSIKCNQGEFVSSLAIYGTRTTIGSFLPANDK